MIARLGLDWRNSAEEMCSVRENDVMSMLRMWCAKEACVLEARASGGGMGRIVVMVGGCARKKCPKAPVGRQLTVRMRVLSCIGMFGIVCRRSRSAWYLVRDLVSNWGRSDMIPMGTPASLNPWVESLEP